jgi:CTD kinase subunit gamma
MERDILRIIDLVAPDDGSGAANVKVVRKVLQQMQSKNFLQPQTVLELEECIAGRDSGALPTSPGHTQGLLEQEGLPSVTRSTPHSTVRDPAYHPGVRLDKRQIEQRIEEDRERHKRAREGIWAIPQQQGGSLGEDAEIEKLWGEISDLDEDDYTISREEQEERRRCFDFEET